MFLRTSVFIIRSVVTDFYEISKDKNGEGGGFFLFCFLIDEVDTDGSFTLTRMTPGDNLVERRGFQDNGPS